MLDSTGVSAAERRLVRRRGRIVQAGTALCTTIMVACYTHSILFFQQVLDEANRAYAPLYSVAIVMPVVYNQMGWVQFCVWMSFHRHWADEMVRVMEAVLRDERAEVWRQRRIRF